MRTVADGAAALAAYDAERPEVLLLDWMMPVLDGLEVCRRAAGARRSHAHPHPERPYGGGRSGRRASTPVPMTTCRSRSPSTSCSPGSAPSSGARRPTTTASSTSATSRSIRPAGGRGGASAELDLTKTEFDLLEMLARNTGIVCTHQMIYERVWGYDFGPDSKALAVYIGYLRRKLEAEGEPRVIFTVRGVGYTRRRAMTLRARLALALGLLAALAASVVAVAGVPHHLGPALRPGRHLTRQSDQPALRPRRPVRPHGVRPDQPVAHRAGGPGPGSGRGPHRYGHPVLGRERLSRSRRPSRRPCRSPTRIDGWRRAARRRWPTRRPAVTAS